MSLIQKVGDMGMAEIIISLVMTKAVMPNCYLPELKAYGHACNWSNALFVFDEHENQFLPYMPLDEAGDQYVRLDELKQEMELVKDLAESDHAA